MYIYSTFCIVIEIKLYYSSILLTSKGVASKISNMNENKSNDVHIWDSTKNTEGNCTSHYYAIGISIYHVTAGGRSSFRKKPT